MEGEEKMAGGLGLAALISNQTLRCAAPTSPDSVDGSGDKASILRRPGPLLFLFQATAQTQTILHGESKDSSQKERGKGQRRLREDEWKKWEDQSATSPPRPHHLTTT